MYKAEQSVAMFTGAQLGKLNTAIIYYTVGSGLNPAFGFRFTNVSI